MLKWQKIPATEKAKAFDKMLSYIRKRADCVYDKDSATDLYEVCKTVACTDLFNFLQDYCEEVK